MCTFPSTDLRSGFEIGASLSPAIVVTWPENKHIKNKSGKGEKRRERREGRREGRREWREEKDARFLHLICDLDSLSPAHNDMEGKGREREE